MNTRGAVPLLLASLFLPVLASASIISSQPDHSLDTLSIELGGGVCLSLAATSTNNLGNLTLFFGANTFANISAPGPRWVATLGLFRSTGCTSTKYLVLYKDSYQPTADNIAHIFDASLGFWDHISYGGYGSQAIATSTPSLSDVRSVQILVSRATTPTFPSNGMSPCNGYCLAYFLGVRPPIAFIL